MNWSACPEGECSGGEGRPGRPMEKMLPHTPALTARLIPAQWHTKTAYAYAYAYGR